MKIAAYCRVSTDKEDQLNSLQAQKEFFIEYTKRTGDELVRLYADEGISGTKIKNRREFLHMMEDAGRGLFEMVVVKDISRFARNTVDLLQNVRKLKAWGIETQFLTANMTSMGNSEFVLTIFGALAQEESANTSKRIKFGKKINAQKGRVPNLVYGYDKTAGDYFHLAVNEKEAAVVRQIFAWYTKEGYGASKIASMLNGRGLLTKRGCAFSQNAVCRILTNELYTGKVINGKEEVKDFLTGERQAKEKDAWIVTNAPNLQIIETETFQKAQKILAGRNDAFHLTHERQSNKHLFSTLLTCSECGWSYRRVVRTYKNTYVRWSCSGHNGNGADSCPNKISIEEDFLRQALEEYFADILSGHRDVLRHMTKELTKTFPGNAANLALEKELKSTLEKLRRTRQKYMDMYTDDLITRRELNEKIGPMKEEQQKLEEQLALARPAPDSQKRLKTLLAQSFQTAADLTRLQDMTNAQLKRLLYKIQIDREGNVDVYLPIFADAAVPISDNRT